MTQKAMVKRRLSAEKVEIVVHRQSACSHNCADCAGCGSLIHEPDVTAVAEDVLGARVGQRVTVESASGKVLGLAALLYLLPFAGLFATYLLLNGRTEGVAALGSICAFFLVLLGVCLPLDRYLRRHKAVTFRVVALEG